MTVSSSLSHYLNKEFGPLSTPASQEKPFRLRNTMEFFLNISSEKMYYRFSSFPNGLVVMTAVGKESLFFSFFLLLLVFWGYLTEIHLMVELGKSCTLIGRGTD